MYQKAVIDRKKAYTLDKVDFNLPRNWGKFYSTKPVLYTFYVKYYNLLESAPQFRAKFLKKMYQKAVIMR